MRRNDPRATGRRKVTMHAAARVGAVVALVVATLALGLTPEAAAAPSLNITKTADAATVAGSRFPVVSWTIRFRCASTTENCTGASITDTLPPGLSVQSFTGSGGLIAGTSQAGNTVRWILVDPLPAGSTGLLNISARAACSTAANQTFANTATFSASNAAAPSTSAPATVTVTAAADCSPPPPPAFGKSGPAKANAGGRLSYGFTIPYSAGAYQIVDAIPSGLRVESVANGDPATHEASCDGGTNYVTIADFGVDATIGACTRAAGTWNIDHVRYAVPANTDPGWGESTSTWGWLVTRVPDAAPVGTTFTNTVTPGNGDPASTVTTEIVADGPMPALGKDRLATPGSTPTGGFEDPSAVPAQKVGAQDIGYSVRFGNDGNSGAAGADLVNPTVTDLLDPNTDYVPGESWWRIANVDAPSQLVGTGCATPTFERIADWNATGRTLLRWKFANCTFPFGGWDPHITIYFTVRVTPGLAPGTNVSNTAQVSPTGGLPVQNCDSATTPLDTNDIDGDGNTTEVICLDGYGNTWTVPRLATFESSKWVNGAADPANTWSRYPAVGETAVAADGYATYHLFLEAVGNVDAKKLEIVDVLPFIGDTSVVEPGSGRGSAWELELTAPVQVDVLPRESANPSLPVTGQTAWSPLPTGYAVSYSPATNPCRLTADSFGQLHIAAMTYPTGCATSPWGGSDAGARSFAISLDRTMRGWAPGPKHGDMLRITVRVKDVNDPVPATDLNKIAWNSFGYTVTDTTDVEYLSSEPIQVGIRMTANPAVTASLGDYVWWDEDHDGVQDGFESGIDGVTVHLKDATGTVVGTYVTGLDPADPAKHGYYRFVGLDPASTYTVVLDNPGDTAPGGPLAGYMLTGTNAGADDAIDNDASLVAGVATIASAPTGAAGSHTPTYDIGFYKAPIYSLGNRVWLDVNNSGTIDPADGVAPGIAGVTVNLYNAAGTTLLATTTTDPSGYYRFDNLAPGDYLLEVAATNFAGPLAGLDGSTGAGQESSPNSDGDSNDNGLDTLVAGAVRSAVVTLGPGTSEPRSESDLAASGQGAVDARANMTVDFGFHPNASIGNYVWYDDNHDGIQNEPASRGVPGVTATLLDNLGNPVTVDGFGRPMSPTRTTDAAGHYLFTQLAAGTYHVVFSNLPAGLSPTRSNQGTDDTVDSDGLMTASVVLGVQESNLTLDLGLFAPVTVGDYTWLDTNADGVQGAGEVPLAGVVVELLDPTGNAVTVDADGNPVTAQTTLADGHYLFNNLLPGTYRVRFTPPTGYLVSASAQGSDGAVDSNAPVATSRALPPGEADLTLDAGFYRPASLGDVVWRDDNANGVHDAGEAGVAGATVELLDGADAVVATATTGTDGTYRFDGLRPGTYRVRFTPPTGLVLTGSDHGGDDAADSDADIVTATSPGVTLVSGQHDPTIDAGVLPAASLAGNVYVDRDGSGTRTPADQPIAGVTLTLTGTDVFGNVVTRTTTTDADGAYSFGDLRPGTYTVTETQPTSYANRVENPGSKGGTAGANVLANVVLGAGDTAQANDFGEGVLRLPTTGASVLRALELASGLVLLGGVLLIARRPRRRPA